MVREGYKQTEVGVIPEDWGVFTIGETVTLINGRAFKPSDWTTYGLPIIRIQNLNDPMAAYNYYEGAIEERYYVNFGDILFAWSGTKESSFGARMWRGQKALLNQHIFRVIPNVEKLTSEYVLLALKRFQEDIERKSHGFKSSFVHVRKSDLENTHLAVPPLPEQRSIAQALFDVDALIFTLDKVIAKKRVIKIGTMQQLLAGKKRLPGFGEGKGYKNTDIGIIPEDWEVKPLKNISSMSGRIGWQGLKQEEFTFNDTDPFLITGMNFKDGKIRWEEVYHVSESRYQQAKNIQLELNDILMTKDGTIGKLLYVEEIPFPGKASLNSHLLLFRSLNNSYFPKFLFYQLSSKIFADYIELNKSGSTFFGITQEAIGNYNAFLPPLSEQSAIAQVLSDMDAEIATLETRRAKTQAIKEGMMQELLTGKTRLI